MTRFYLSVFTLVMLLGGCSNPPANQPATSGKIAEKKPEAKPAEFITGRDAFQRLWVAARNWSPDARPLTVESRPRPGDKRDGTASVWTASFASAQRGQVRSFLWSGASGEGAPPRGIEPGSVDVYSAGNASTQPFDPAYLQADTDKALATADKKAPPAAKKDKNGAIRYQLYNDTAKQRLLWRVIYGQSESNAKAVVDISTREGGFVKIEH